MRPTGRSDSEIQQDVWDRIGRTAAASAAGIDVAVAAGVVTLLGTVPSPAAKRAARRAAARVTGVRGTIDDLVVVPPIPRHAARRGDRWLAPWRDDG